MTALNDDIPLAILSAQDHTNILATSQRSPDITNIHIGTNQHVPTSGNNSFRSVVIGG